MPTLTQSSIASVSPLASGCTDNSPCSLSAGAYVTGAQSVLSGITLTLPGGWSSSENDRGELNLIPPSHPDERLFIWEDTVAVKSSGTGHGTTLLTNIATKSSALISWLTSNTDFHVASPPAASTIGHGISVTSIIVGVSHTAQYGDTGCPANPRCADLFTRPTLWGANFYGLGGDSEVHLCIAAITINGRAHTFFLALEAPDHQGLVNFTSTAQPILDSLRLPASVIAG